MKKVTTVGAALLLTTSIANAGGIDRSGNAYSVLFEEGNYAQLSFSSASPEVSGDYPEEVGGGSTDNMAKSYNSVGFAVKYGLSETVDIGVFVNQPFGADASYTAGFYEGLSATWDSNQVSAVVKYQAAPGISVFGGLRAVTSQAEIAIPSQLIRAGAASNIPDAIAGAIPDGASFDGPGAAAFLSNAAFGLTPEQIGQLAPALVVATAPAAALDYSAETNSDTQIGYVAGVAYERPEIALRVALTYESGLTHEFESTETLLVTGANEAEGEFEIEMPQSVTLDFQSGVAEDTLVFGSIRWSEWSVWEVRPTVYEGLTNDRVTGLDNDVFTYRIGVGRRINEDLSVFARVTYEDANGGVASRLAPTDGSVSYGFGGSYAINDDFEVSGGIEYAVLGDADDGLTAFEDNTALGFGINIGYSF